MRTLPVKFTAPQGTDEEVIGVGPIAVHPANRRELRPVTDLMHQRVRDDLLWRRSDLIVQDGEGASTMTTSPARSVDTRTWSM